MSELLDFYAETLLPTENGDLKIRVYRKCDGDEPVAIIKGQVVDFGRSYRGAVNLFQNFVRELRSDGRFGLVAVRRTPFDIDPQAAIAGDSGIGASASSRDRASYELLLRVRHGDDRV